MFRPDSFHPRGGLPLHSTPYPGHSVGVMSGPHFLSPTLPLHEGAGFQSLHLGGQWYGFSPSGPPPSAWPVPPPESPPLEAPPPRPIEGNFRPTSKPAPPPPRTIEGNFRPTSKPAPPPPPAMPKDPEMLKNIEVLSSFVVKNGSQFEQMARAKQASDPKFAFLFGGEPGTEAALGFDFYNWKKDHLMWLEERTRASPADPKRILAPHIKGQRGRSEGYRPSLESPKSPTGSDMDMEDDFGLPVQLSDEKPCAEKIPTFTSAAAERQSGFSAMTGSSGFSSAAGNCAQEFSTPAFDRTISSSLRTAGQKVILPGESTQSVLCHTLTKAGAQDVLHQIGNRRLPTQPAVTVLEGFRGTRQQKEFDQACMEDVNSQCYSVWMKQGGVHPAHQREVPGLDFDENVTSASGLDEGVTRIPCWVPQTSSGLVLAVESLCNKGADTVVNWKRNEEVDIVTQDRQDSSRSHDIKSPDVTAKARTGHEMDYEKLKIKPGIVQPAVDEFGRLLRNGVSDSDGEDNHHRSRKRQTCASSRNRQHHSSGDAQCNHWSPGCSPRRRVRRSRSWSRSPRRNKSDEHTPPRDGKWGGEKGDQGSSKDGRPVSTGLGGPSRPSFDFGKRKRFRGYCKNFHEEFDEETHGQHGRWSDEHPGRESGQEGGRNQNVLSRDGRLLRARKAIGNTRIDFLRETELTEDLKRQDGELLNDQAFRHGKGKSEGCGTLYSAEEPEPVKSSIEISVGGFTPREAATSSSQISVRDGFHLGEMTNIFQSPSSLQQQSGLPSASTTLKLGSLVSISLTQQKSFAISSAQSLKYSPAHGRAPSAALLTCHLSECEPNLPNQKTEEFTSSPNINSVCPPLQPLQPTFSPVSISNPRTCNSQQLAKSSKYPINSGPGDTKVRSPGVGAQSHMLPQFPDAQKLLTGQPWLPGSPLPWSFIQSPPQVPPLELSGGQTMVYSYSLPCSYPMLPCSNLSLNNATTKPPLAQQYDPLEDSIEPRAPGSGDNSLVSNKQSLSQRNLMTSSPMEHWSHHPGNVSAPLMTRTGEVILENVSPGLQRHVDSEAIGNVYTQTKSCRMTENKSQKSVVITSTSKAVLDASVAQHGELMRNVMSNENPVGAALEPKESVPWEKERTKDNEVHVRFLLQGAVADYVKHLLKPTWKEGQMSKEAFKTITKKAVDKIMGALRDKGQIPKSQEKLSRFLSTSKPKIAKLVQGYIDKYVKA